mmetsp:Transcript_96473/g.268084  ORF Transcript_96473/g.268084 Transcript_96473/m.268084 type:complete len:209 (-) Transcript_96473:1674-2300(-)
MLSAETARMAPESFACNQFSSVLVSSHTRPSGERYGGIRILTPRNLYCCLQKHAMIGSSVGWTPLALRSWATSTDIGSVQDVSARIGMFPECTLAGVAGFTTMLGRRTSMAVQCSCGLQLRRLETGGGSAQAKSWRAEAGAGSPAAGCSTCMHLAVRLLLNLIPSQLPASEALHAGDCHTDLQRESHQKVPFTAPMSRSESKRPSLIQ